MKNHIAKLMIGLLSFAILAPVAVCIDVTVEGGDYKNVYTTTSSFSSDSKGMVDQMTTLDTKGGVKNHIGFSGSLALSRSITDKTNGDYAKIYASVSGGPGLTYGSYDYVLFKDEGSHVYAKEWLNAYNAYTIKAYGYASNLEGDKSQAYVSAYSPTYKASLKNYYTYAYSSPSKAYAYQSADYVKGTEVQLDTHSWNKEGDEAEAYTFITNGVAKVPKVSAESRKSYAKATVTSLKVDAPSGTIKQRMYADNSIDASYVESYTTRGYLYTYPYSSSYKAYSYASKVTDYTRATQSEYVYDYPIKVHSYSYINGVGAVEDTDYYYGYNKIGQHAYTDGADQDAWNTLLA